MEFINPNILWCAVIIPLLAAYYIFVGSRGASIKVSTLGNRPMPRTLRYWLRPLPYILRLAAIAVAIVAFARPYEKHGNSQTTVEGIDIVLAMDVSSSMHAMDFSPNRLEAAKRLAAEFVNDRMGDRFSIVAFAGEAYSVSYISSDVAMTQSSLANLRSGIIEDGTAIGNGLATALNRVRESDAKSKVIILLTDGVNNRGQVSPIMAAEVARDMGVKVYTIGVGANGKAKYPATDIFGNVTTVMADVEIDEELLQSIAETTGGKYFRATNEKALSNIYDEINELEKSEVQVTTFFNLEEKFMPWIILALLLLGAEFIVARLILNRIP